MQDIRTSLPIKSHRTSLKMKRKVKSKMQNSTNTTNFTTVEKKAKCKNISRVRTDFEAPLHKLYIKQLLCNSKTPRQPVNIPDQSNPHFFISLAPSPQSTEKQRNRNFSLINILRRKQQLRSKNMVKRMDRSCRHESIGQIVERWKNNYVQLTGEKKILDK